MCSADETIAIWGSTFWSGTSVLPSLETQGLLVGTTRYFQVSEIFGVKVYFEGWRAPGHFSLPNEFQRRSKFFSGRSTRRSSRVILSPFYTKWFSSPIGLVAWPWQPEDSREEFQNEDLTKKYSSVISISQANSLLWCCLEILRNIPIVTATHLAIGFER